MFGMVGRWIDWKFMTATAVLLLVAMVSWSSFNAAEERDQLVVAAKADRVRASQERQELLRGQQVLRDQYAALLKYVESEGIAVPASVLGGGEIAAANRDSGPRITIRSGGSGDSESGTKSGPHPGTNSTSLPTSFPVPETYR